MKKRVIRAVIIGVALLVVWFPIAWLAEFGHDPISGAYSFHLIGSPFRVAKAILEFPLSWSGPDHPVNSAVAASAIFLAIWIPVIMLLIEGVSVVSKRKNKCLPNITSEPISNRADAV